MVQSLLVELTNPLGILFCRLTKGNSQNQALEALLYEVLVSHFSFLFFYFPCNFIALITLYAV